MIKIARSLMDHAFFPVQRRLLLRLAESIMTRCFRSSVNDAPWSIRFERTGTNSLSGCWGTRGAKIVTRGGAFAAQ